MSLARQRGKIYDSIRRYLGVDPDAAIFCLAAFIACLLEKRHTVRLPCLMQAAI